MPIDPSIPLQARAPQINSPLQTLGQVMQVKAMQQEGQQRDLQMQQTQQAMAEQQRQIAAQRLLDQVMSSSVNEDGSFNSDAVIQGVAKGGYGHLVPGLQKTFTDIAESHAKLTDTVAKAEVAKQDYLGSLAAGVKDQNYSLGAYATAVAGAVRNKMLDPARATQMLAPLYGPDGQLISDPAAIQHVTDALIRPTVDGLLKQSPKQTELETARLRANRPVSVGVNGMVDPVTGAVVVPPAEQHSPAYKEWQDYRASGGTLDFNAYQTMDANRKRARITGAAGLTPAQLEISLRAERNRKTAAERWKQTQLLALEKRHSTEGLTADQMDAEKLRIQNSYLEQIGAEPQAELGAEWHQVGATPVASAVPAPSPTTAPPVAPGSKGVIAVVDLAAKAKAWNLTIDEARKRAIAAGYDVR